MATRPDEWEVTATAAANTAVVATKAAGSNGKRRIITSIFASYDGTAVGNLSWKRGTSVKGNHYVHQSDVLQMEFRGNQDEAVEAELAAVVGRIGRITMHGYDEG
jgi:hypothetical protein